MKNIIALLNYLCILISIYFVIIFYSNQNFFLSRLDPNYWIQLSLKETSVERIDSAVINSLELSLNNQKYKLTSMLNFIYLYDRLSENTKLAGVRYFGE